MAAWADLRLQKLARKFNQVNCCVKRLRRKLGPDGPTYIVTARGIGYRMLTKTERQERAQKS